MRKTKNDETLSNYINKKIEDDLDIPYMTKISKDTGVSVATISRFAIRKGYYNFAQMRAKFNTENFNNDYNDRGLITFLKNKTSKVYIVSSRSTKVLAFHLEQRLTIIGLDATLINNDANLEDGFKDVQKDDRIIFFSISGETLSFHKWVNTKKTNLAVLVSTKNTKAKSNYTNFITLKEYVPTSNSKLDISKTINQMFNWLDKTIDIYQTDLLK